MGSRRRNVVILLIVLGLMAASAAALTGKRTVLGLDLRGGTELVYQGRPTPQNPDVTPQDIDDAIEIIRDRVDSLGVAEPEIARVGADQITVALPDVQNADRAERQVGDTAQLYFYDWEPNVVPQDPDVSGADERPINRLYDAVVFASERKPECFQDLCTTNERGAFYLFDGNTLELLAGPATAEGDLFIDFKGGRRPPGTKIVEVPQGTVVVQEPAADDDPSTDADESETTPRGYFVLRDRPELTGDDIRNPEQNFDPNTNQPVVTFDFSDEGREAFAEVTRRIAERGAASAPPGTVTSEQASNFSDSFAVVLDDEVVSRPIINFIDNPQGIDGRTGAQIEGSFTIQGAQDLAEFLRIGALPIRLVLISSSTVSASLGEQALDQGLKAGLIGLAIVLAFLIAYYRFLGVVAGLGLLVYALFFFALIKLIPITMTLPGIAGLILTIGVAADANIVIFERIKEEIRKGRSTLSAIGQGYRHGIATIIDANVITLITAFILFVLATAGVKGFAFVLGVGTLVSLFTAVLFTQAFLGLLGRTRLLRSPRFLGAGERHVSWNFDFTGASRWFFSMSGLILTIGGIAFATKQLNLGIDFESGTRITAGLEQPADVEAIRTTLSDADIEGAESAEVQEVSNEELGENGIQINAKIPPEQASDVRPLLEREFGVVGGGEGYQSTTIGPTFGAQVARAAVVAIIFSLLVISIYVAVRFEAKYAIPVLIALVHDVLITGGVYSLTAREVSSGTVAAFLTILGYSMYDTIIVFDRIRENVPRMPRAAFSQIVNRSMSEVLTRSLITGLSTVFLIGVLLALGGDTLKDFAFAMMVGVASGTYSSIFIASPVLTAWKEREPTYRSRRARIAEVMGYVPTFPEDNVVQRVEGTDGEGAGGLPPQQEPEPARAEGAATGPAVAAPAVAEAEPLDAEPEPTAETDAPPAPAPARPNRQQRRRRKHGRPR
jgi:SecD/SecF fusion protein